MSLILTVAILDIVVDNANFQGGCDSVRSNDETPMIYISKVNGEVRFSASQSMVEVRYMFVRVHYELVGIVCAHRNDNSFPRRVFSCHIDPRSGFVFIVKDSLVDFFNFFV